MDPVELAELTDHFVSIAQRAAAVFDTFARTNPTSAAQAQALGAKTQELAALHLGHAAALRAMRSATSADDVGQPPGGRPPFPAAPMTSRTVPAPVVDRDGAGDSDLVAVGQVPAS